MSKAWMKFLLKINSKIRLKIELIITKIMLNDFEGLHIQSITGKEGYYRVRVGKIRIIFIKGDENIIDDIGYRGDIYKGL